MKNKPIIIIDSGPYSIFLEILIKCLKKKKFKHPLLLISNKNYLKKQMKLFKFNKKINNVDLDKLKNATLDNKRINLINVNLKLLKSKKDNDKFLKKYIKNSFEIAINIIKKKISHKLLNGPINKKLFLNKKFLGVTEYISSFFNKKTSMLIYNKALSVCPLTTHLPIKLVSKKVTKKLVENKLIQINKFYKKYFNIKPKIGVTGLNPHCESISRYNEDESIIEPAIKLSQKKNISVYGPYSADTIFLKQNRKKFNVILGMYHDQVLAPLKTLYEYEAINVTMGLPFLRVSPDHGPNEKMVNKNLSNPTSLIKALEFLDKN